MGGKNSKKEHRIHHSHKHAMHLTPFLDVEVYVKADDRCSFSGITCLKNGRIVVADYLGHYVKYYDWKTLKLLDYIETSSPPYEVCSSALNDNEVFVTFPFEQRIQHLSVTDNKVELIKEIPTEGMCYGIGSYVNGLAVSLRLDKHVWQIEILDYLGSVQNVFKDDAEGKELFGFIDYIAVDKKGERLYVSDGIREAVVCYNLKEATMTSIKEIFTYTCVHLRIPKGITIDNSGNIFIIGCESSNVHKVSRAGQRYGVVLGHREQLQNPMGIVYDVNEKKVFVTEGSRKVMIFTDNASS
ncbi:hypothetical protein ACF0H5_022122 [Mactra antiquata]